jgi:hypothetical protein
VAAPGAAINTVATAKTYGNFVLGDRSISMGRIVFYTGNIFGNAIYLATP